MLSKITGNLTNMGFVFASAIVAVLAVKAIRSNFLGIQRITGQI